MRYGSVVRAIIAGVSVLVILISCTSKCPSCSDLRRDAGLECATEYGGESGSLGFTCIPQIYTGCGMVTNQGTCTNPLGGPTLPFPTETFVPAFP
jgi:hypothetical protein